MEDLPWSHWCQPDDQLVSVVANAHSHGPEDAFVARKPSEAGFKIRSAG
jgi:hypothetical protein